MAFSLVGANWLSSILKLIALPVVLPHTPPRGAKYVFIVSEAFKALAAAGKKVNVLFDPATDIPTPVKPAEPLLVISKFPNFAILVAFTVALTSKACNEPLAEPIKTVLSFNTPKILALALFWIVNAAVALVAPLPFKNLSPVTCNLWPVFVVEPNKRLPF